MRELTRQQRVALLILLLLGAFLCGWLIWPTAYIMVHEKGEVFRVNRFTGVREQSTEKGWMTGAELDAERKAKADQKDAADRARSGQILEELKKQIKVDDERSDISKLALYNPTDWELSKGVREGGSGDTVVEYYQRQKGKDDVFLAKAERQNFSIKAQTHNDFRLYDYGMLPREVSALPEGSNFVQKITITFGLVSNTRSSVQADKFIELQPAFVLKHERSWVASSPSPVSLVDWLIREKQRRKPPEDYFDPLPQTTPKKQ